MSVCLKLSILTTQQLSIIRKLLFLQPKENFIAKKNSYSQNQGKSPILFYFINKYRDEIYIPYAFANKLLGKNINFTLDYPKCSFQFFSEPRPNQLKVFEDSLNYLLTSGSVILKCHPGFGKCLAKGTLILLPNGSKKSIERLRVGDMIQGDDSTPKKILSICSGLDKMYKIIPEYGESFISNSVHVLTLFDSLQNKIIDISLDKYLKLHKTYHLHSIWSPVSYPTQKIPQDPFTFGKSLEQDSTIPVSYKFNSFEIRKQFIEGYKCSNLFQVPIKNKDLANDLLDACRSLGWKSFLINTKNGKLLVAECKEVGKCQYVKFKVEYVGMGEYYGFTLNGNGRFLLGSHMLTHNTVTAAYLSSKIDGPILVLYHCRVLQKQWKDTFLRHTNAKIWVNGETPPNEYNVILSMDTIVYKLPTEIIDSIKCLIIDEAHAFCVPSRVSCLLATRPKYIIACSATLDSRNDGMQDMIYAMCGKNIVVKQSEKPFDVYKVMTGIQVELVNNRAGMVNWAQFNKDLTENSQRNKYILDLIFQNPQQKIMVLTWTKAHVSYLFEKLQEKGIVVDYLCGSKKMYNDSQVLVGTISKIGTGFDEATFCHDFKGRKSNVMIICGSVKNIGSLEQFVGRVFRSDFPTVFHLVDDNRISKNHWRGCEKWYRFVNGKIFLMTIDEKNVNDNNERRILTQKDLSPENIHINNRLKPMSQKYDISELSDVMPNLENSLNPSKPINNKLNLNARLERIRQRHNKSNKSEISEKSDK